MRVPWKVPIRDLWGLGFRGLQYPSIKEYTFNNIRDPTTI